MDGVDIHPAAGTIEVTSTFKARNKIKGGGVVDNNASRMKVSTLPLSLLRCRNFDVRKRCGQGFYS